MTNLIGSLQLITMQCLIAVTIPLKLHQQNSNNLDLYNKIEVMPKNSDNMDEQDFELPEMTLLQSPSSSIQQFFLQGRVKTVHKQENTNFGLLINFICQSLCFAHVWVVQQILSGEQCSSFLVQIFNPSNSAILYRILQIYSIIMKLLILQLIYVEVVCGSEIIWFSWLNKKILESFYIVKKMDFVISGYLLLFSWSENIAIYAVSLGIQVFYALYMQNYIFRKDAFYVTSSMHYILWITIVSISYGINIILLNLGNYFYFTVSHLILGPLVLIWYSRWGKELFANNIVKISYLFLYSIYGSFCLGLAEHLFFGIPLYTIKTIYKSIFSFLFIAGVLKFTESRQSRFIKEQYKGHLKEYQIFALNLLEESFINKEAQSLLMGLLYSHLCVQCINKQCPFLKDKIFDPIIKMEIKTREIHGQRDSALRLYFKCLYEYEISQNPYQKKILLDYSEFLYNQTGNIYLLMKQLQKIQNLHLNIIEKVKISKLKILMAEENMRLNDQLYDGRLDLEHIIESEEVFSIIERDIKQYMYGNLMIWKSFSQSLIDMSVLRIKISDNFKLIDSISECWKKISKHLNIHKQWKFLYLNFMLFFKNDKGKQKQLDQSKQSPKNVFHNNKIFFEETKFDKDIFMQSLMYDRESFCVKTVLQNSNLIIKDVSKHFQKNTHYNSDEIKGVHLSSLMPESIREPHAQAVMKWIEQGHQADFNSYQVRFTCFLNKQGEQFPVLKFYKIFCNVENGLLEFICLLKKNMKTQIDDPVQNTQRQIAYIKKMSSVSGMVSAVQLQQEFSPPQKSNKFVLANNIFIKEQTLLPSKRFQVIQHFKLSSRIFTSIILASIVILALISSSYGNNLLNYGVQFISFMNMYRFPMLLGTNYIKSFMNVGNLSVVQSQISSATYNLQFYSSQQLTIKTLFDPGLNAPSLYYPYYSNIQMGMMPYDQIDLFYLMLSTISSLSSPPINRTSQSFKQFNAFLKPAYDTMVNSTKYQLQNKFESMFQQIKITTIIFIIVQAVVFFIFIIITFYYVHSAIKKMKNIFTILLDFRPSDVEKINTYWIKMNKSFRNIFHQMEAQRFIQMKPSRISNQKSVDQQNMKAASNFKFKVVEGKMREQYQFRLRVLIIFMTIIIILLAISIEINMMIGNQNLSKLEVDGFYFLKYFPVGPIVGYGCMQKYYSLNYPSQIQFNPNRYADDLSTMFIFGHSDYIGSVQDSSSAYYSKQKNYFYGNPCVYNPAPLNTTTVNVSSCQNLSHGTFKQGLSAFLRYGYNQANSYINGRTLMTSAQLQQLTLSFTVLSAYVLDALSTWQNQFTSKVQEEYQLSATLQIIMSILICLLHVIVNEFIIANRISKEYEFICKVYEYMVPEYILMNEKVIRQKFIIQGLINE